MSPDPDPVGQLSAIAIYPGTGKAKASASAANVAPPRTRGLCSIRFGVSAGWLGARQGWRKRRVDTGTAGCPAAPLPASVH